MKIVDIDYYALNGRSWLHKIPVKYKLISVFLILALSLLISDAVFSGVLYFILLSVIIFSDLPKVKIILFSIYPLIFLALYIFSMKSLSYNYFCLLFFRVLGITTSFVLLIFTTSYIQIFCKLEKIFPNFLVNALFLTYRSIFILWSTLDNIKLSMYLRGKIKLTRPIYSIKLISNAIGHLIIDALESGEKMYECMKLRGYSGSLRYLRK